MKNHEKYSGPELIFCGDESVFGRSFGCDEMNMPDFK